MISGAYGRTQIELHKLRDGRDSCERMLESGTPRECLGGMHHYITHYVKTPQPDAAHTALKNLLDRAVLGLDQSATHDGLQNVEAIAQARAALNTPAKA